MSLAHFIAHRIHFISDKKEGKNVEWLELVSDEEYENALKEARG